MSRAETAQLIWNLINTLGILFESEEQMKVLGKDKAYPVSENDLDSKQNDSDTVESEPQCDANRGTGFDSDSYIYSY